MNFLSLFRRQDYRKSLLEFWCTLAGPRLALQLTAGAQYFANIDGGKPEAPGNQQSEPIPAAKCSRPAAVVSLTNRNIIINGRHSVLSLPHS
jgi:hypothetical protein